MPPIRNVESIEKDFAELLVSHLPGAVARDKLERLWDEVNTAAARLVLTRQVSPYLSLLKRMQEVFEIRYREGRPINGKAVRRTR